MSDKAGSSVSRCSRCGTPHQADLPVLPACESPVGARAPSSGRHQSV